ncbi:MAG TPA: hypothetical protein PK821_05685, partial [Victivallales bacterium]|nr:hypothetical protein [Victivallales bacterium]
MNTHIRKSTQLIIYFLIFIASLEIYSAELIPNPFQIPKVREGKSTLSPHRNDEQPYFDSDGKARIDIDLCKYQIIPNCLLSISIGRELSFFPAEQYRIYFPNHHKGVKGYVLVRIADQKILFKHITDEQYNTFFQSWNFPQFFIKRSDMRLSVVDYKQRMEYLFSTLNGGYTWILDEIRNIDFTELSLKLEYNDRDLLKSIILPDSSKYTIEYSPMGLVSKVTDPDGAFTVVTWDDRCQLKQIKTCIPPEHFLYPKDKSTITNSKPAPIAVRTLKIECDSSGKLVGLINSSGEKYVVEYRSDKKEECSYFCAVMKNPDNTINFCKVEWKHKKKDIPKKKVEKTLDISKGTLSYDTKGKEKFETLEVRTYEKKGNAYSEVFSKINGVENDISYNSDGTASELTNAKGESTKYSYNEKGVRTGIAYPDGTGNSQQYDENYRLVRKTDDKGVETKYSYDKLGHLMEVSETGDVAKYTYDSENNTPAKTTLPDGSSHS